MIRSDQNLPTSSEILSAACRTIGDERLQRCVRATRHSMMAGRTSHKMTETIVELFNMPLVDIEISIDDSALPDDVADFLREADLRVNQFVEESAIRITGFVPSGFATVYRALHAISKANLATETSFCEWGSGFGVVASLAAMLGYKACGIEIEKGLVDASRRLAGDFGLPLEFIHGSFVPPIAEAEAEEAGVENSGQYFWLVTDADDAYDELGRDPDDFGVVFAYPWPGEECLIESLFEKYAAEGALFLTYNQFDSVRIQRKVGNRAGGS